MKLAIVVFLFGLALFLIGFLAGPKKLNDIHPFSTNQVSSIKKTIYSAWVPSWKEKDAIDSINQISDAKLSIILPVWYSLDDSGHITTIPSQYKSQIIELADAKGIKIMPTINNATPNGFDPKRVSNLISNAEYRKELIAEAIKNASEMKYIGWDLDLEELNDSDKSNYTKFVSEFADSLHSNKLLISVTVHAQTGEDNDWGSLKGQDIGELSKYADYIRIMAYDFHNSKSSPGSVIPVNDLLNVIKHTVSIVNVDKIILGLPTYGYDWSGVADATPYQYDNIIDVIEKSGAKEERDSDSYSLRATYISKSIKHEVWYEDYISIQKKVDIAKNSGIYQFCFWSLGGEDKRIWKDLK